VPGLFGDNIRARERRQQQRIHEGVKSGELTKKEAAKLERQEAQLHRQIQRDRVDGGGLSAKERAKAHKKQNNLSRKISREKHDKQDRN
jgi:hypothetical protein